MKYPIILKYNYSYVSSGNNYQKAEREYYQLFTDMENSKMFSLSTLSHDIVVDIQGCSENEISFTHSYRVYVSPHTYCRDLENVTNAYTLKKGEAVECPCADLYWRYAGGGENAPATLRVEWLSYEDFFRFALKEAQTDSYKMVEFGKFLIDEGNYNLAFKLLKESGYDSYPLGLCYEKGYGTEKNREKALEIYIGIPDDYNANRAIERILSETEGKEIKFDNVKKTVLLEKFGFYKEAYGTAEIATEANDNTLQAMRRNVELNITAFLEQGYPFNNSSRSMERLAKYYDMVNGVPENERKVYFETWAEEDEYDGGYFHMSRFYKERAIETFVKEAEKNDVIALGVLLLQYPNDIDIKEDVLERLTAIARDGEIKEKGFANYVLGLYYKRELKEEEIAFRYFEEALKCDFHLAIVHVAQRYVYEDPAAYEKIAKHHPYVPGSRGGQYISNSVADYYMLRNIFGFSVWNEYIPIGRSRDIGRFFSEKYRWRSKDVAPFECGADGSAQSWGYILKAATEEKDVYAIATILFYKIYDSEHIKSHFAIEDEHLLAELVSVLENREEQDAFTSFLLGRAYFCLRGTALCYEQAQAYFRAAHDKGLVLAKLFELEIAEDYDGIFPVANRLIKEFPDSHIVKFYLGYCYYYGAGTKKDRAKAASIFRYTKDLRANDPIDYYFLTGRYILGLCYFHGCGVEKNTQTAAELFRLSSGGYNPEATYAMAITELLSDGEKDPVYIFNLLRESALKGYLPAVRKVMLCLRAGYGTEADKALYIEYMEFYDYYRGDREAFSDLGKEADTCDLIDCDGNHIKDTEIVEEEADDD